MSSRYLLALLLVATSVMGSEFWVSPTGDDRNAGNKSKPFATLERAREAAREAHKTKAQSAGGITINLRGGDYYRTNSLQLGSEDSGRAESPILWRNAPGETPRLLGGHKLSGFKSVNDEAILKRLTPSARTNVLQLDLKSAGITAYGEMKSRGFGRPAAVSHCELFYDHRPMTLARWPNDGEFDKIAGYPASADRRDEHGGNLGELPGGFNYSGDRPSGWADTSDLWVHGYWAYDWANSYEKVATLDVKQRLVKTASPFGLYGFRKGQRFYFLNVLEELDQPGEWFLDRKTGILFFWPPAKTSKTPEILFSTLDQALIRMTGVSNVTIRGITLESARGNGIEIHEGENCLIAGCVIRNLGNSGVTIDSGNHNGVTSCDILDTGDGGVSLAGGDRKTLQPGNHFVENCHFQRQGRWTKCYVPAIALNGVGMRASHNLIHDHPHCAILFWGNDHLMEYNEIHHIALETGDVGAIYTGRDYSFRGNRIRHNFIHHTGGVGMGSMGVYMDDCVSGTEVFGNVFYKVHWAMFIGGGRDHRVENNLFVDCDPAVRADGRGLDKTPVWHDMVYDYMRKQLAAVPQPLYRQHYPDLVSLDKYYGPPEGPAITGDAFKGIPPENNLISHNVCVGKWFDAGWHAVADNFRIENNLTNAVTTLQNPITDNSRPRDFALKTDAAAWKMGFQKIPLDEIGLQENEFRKALSRMIASP